LCIESNLYAKLRPSIKLKDLIAAELNTANHTYLQSWLQSFAQIRNICAHHGRFWNKNLPGRPKVLRKLPTPWLVQVPPVTVHHKIYVHLCCMKYLLDVIRPGHHYASKLSDLLAKYPTVDIHALGLNAKWQSEALWVR